MTMEYCPYCAETVPAGAKICPSCKKNIDLQQVQNLYQEDTVELNKSVARGLWFREHASVLYPILFLIIGLAGGAIGAYSYSLIHFASVENSYQIQIAQLNATIRENASKASHNVSSVQQDLSQKEQIVEVLKNQRRIMSQIINFTRRLAENSVITTADPSQTDYYNRNVRYLINQYNLESEKLKSLGISDDDSFNLITVPQALQTP